MNNNNNSDTAHIVFMHTHTAIVLLCVYYFSNLTLISWFSLLRPTETSHFTLFVNEVFFSPACMCLHEPRRFPAMILRAKLKFKLTNRNEREQCTILIKNNLNWCCDFIYGKMCQFVGYKFIFLFFYFCLFFHSHKLNMLNLIHIYTRLAQTEIMFNKQ